MNIYQYNETIQACRSCLMCRHACTVGNATLRDTNLPRGKALMLFAEQMGLLGWDERAVQVVYECTNCHLCREWCAKGWDIAPVMMAARADVVEMGLAPESASAIKVNVERTGNPYGETESRLAGWLSTMPAPDTAEVLYFMGCEVAHRRPEIAEATVRILQHNQADFTILRDEPCCGDLLYVLGFRAEATEQAKRAMERIEATGARTVISSCPTGIDAFRHYYREWGVDLPDNVRFLHTAEYLAEEIEAGRLKLTTPQNLTLTYHDPCSLGRELRVYEEPRRVLAAIPGITFREMRLNRGHSPCCGNGGGVPATHFDVAFKAGENAGEIILETGADALVTACPSCKQSLSKHVPGMDVLDIAELVVKAL